jgi:hypothetical protein
MQHPSLHTAILKLGFKFKSATGCDCNDYYILAKSHGSLVIQKQKCMGEGPRAKRHNRCKWAIEFVVKGRINASGFDISIDGIKKIGQSNGFFEKL